MNDSGSTSQNVRRRLQIVDDHPIVRRALADLLANETDIEVCGEADNVEDGLKQIEALRPDLVVVDIALNASNGVELISEMKATYPSVKTLVWSMYDEMIFAERALRAGATGYVNKREPIETILGAIRTVLDGGICLSPQMSNRLLRRMTGSGPLEEDPMHRLTNRELEVFELMGHGKTARQIAGRLMLSHKTVETHREKIKTKLGIDNAAELSHRAIQWVLENS